MPATHIAVLMTCYNRRDTTLECLRSLYAQELPEGLRLDVYLVDDGCTDGTGDAVREQFPDVNVLQGDGNLYWCGGMRLAWTEAATIDYDAYLWLNDDTALLPGALGIMLDTERKVLEKEGRDGIIVGSCRDPKTGKHSYGGRVKKGRYSLLPNQPMLPGDHIQRCDTMNGNLVLVPREPFNLLGNLSPEYDHSFGDVDYGMRARRSHVSIWVAPGHLAECVANTRVRLWTVPTVPLKERWHDMCGPHGLPPKQWYQYVKRHTGAAWPFYFIKPIIRVIFPRLWGVVQLKTTNRVIRVGMFGRYYPNYRLGVFNNISNMDDIDLNVYASLEPIQGFSLIDPSEAEFPLMNTAVWQLHIPFIRRSIEIIPYSIWCMLWGKYDVFVLPNKVAELGVWINLLLNRLLGRRVCLWGHGFSKRDGPWIIKLRKLMMRLAYANILYSESGRNKAIAMGIAPGKLFIAYNALDTNESRTIRQEATSDKIEEFKSIHNINSKKVILFIGRLLEYKRPDVLIEAMPHILRKIPEAHSIIIGDGPMREKLQTRIKSRGLEDNVQLKGALFDENQISYYLMSSSVAVMPAAAGLIIQHAFYYGVPIVVGNNMKSHGPEIDIVAYGKTGIFCKDGDANEFADSICRLLADEEERQRMSANCRKIIEEKYNVQTMTSGFVKAVRYAKTT